MAPSTTNSVGQVDAIRRYPVKSLRGEAIPATTLTSAGLLGDRAFALLDSTSGKIASAKNPRLWPRLFDFHAAYAHTLTTRPHRDLLLITCPDGQTLAGSHPDLDATLSRFLGRPVQLVHSPPTKASAEGYWPDHDWLPERDVLFEFPLPPGTFFDAAPVHLVTSATLHALAALAPQSQFDLARFRPNFLIQTPPNLEGFVENQWIGRMIQIGSALLRIEGPCPRCVMTTLPQPGLPNDPEILRAAVHYNRGHVGVYASVIQPGEIHIGTDVFLAERESATAASA